MTRKIKEKSVQNYLYENLENLPDLIKLENLQSQYKLDREDLVFRPLKYLLNKKYQNIFEKMTNFWEYLHKFTKEFTTAELWNSKPRIDILGYHEDPSTFYITEVKWDKWPERQTITELLQYANWLQTNDFPWLANEDIVFVVVAREWSNILIQSVVNWIVFKNLNILPIKVSNSKKVKDLEFSFFDLWETWILEHLNKQIYNEENYPSRLLAFDEFEPWTQNWTLKAEYKDMQKITMMTAVELAHKWNIGYVLGMEHDWNLKWPSLVYKNAISVLYFDPMSLYTKNWEGFTKKKIREIKKFNSENQYFFDTTILRNNINFHYPNKKLKFKHIEFEEWHGWVWLTWLTSQWWLFSYWYPIWFLEVLIKDFISYCREDKTFAYQTIETDDVDWDEQISHYMYLDTLFEIYKRQVNSMEELNEVEFREFIWEDGSNDSNKKMEE